MVGHQKWKVDKASISTTLRLLEIQSETHCVMQTITMTLAAPGV
jgi:hypothetical protein